MSYVKVSDFQKYTGIRDQSKSNLQQAFINSAEEIVENYLGYTPMIQIYTHYFNGNGTNQLQLRAKPIRSLSLVEIEGRPMPLDEFLYETDEFITYTNGVFPYGLRNVRVGYVAGYENAPLPPLPPDPDEFEDGGDAGSTFDGDLDGGEADSFNTDDDANGIPRIIRLTVLRIAALLQSESDENIGVTGKSFGENGSRTFVNYTNFDKYLLPISKYKLVRI
jgi:hypothetical protein